ncbi:MAG: LysR substrate-binding domain-containing protein [Pseudomonadota bacterium]
MNAPSTPQIPLLDLDLLRTLVAIAETGSFSAAATMVHRTPSAISMQVKKMEDIVGRAVFVRDSRSVALTPDGMFLVEHARRMLAMNRDALARFVSPDVEGVVRLGAPDDTAERFLPPMLKAFAETHPLVSVNVFVDGTSKMTGMLRAGKLDLAIVTCEAGLAKTEGAEVLFREGLVWAMRECGVAGEQDPIPVSVWEEGCVWRNAGLQGLAEQGRAWRIAFQSAHISGQKAAILADLAIAPIPRSCLGGAIVEAPARLGLPPLPDYALGLLIGSEPTAATRSAADHIHASFCQTTV